MTTLKDFFKRFRKHYTTLNGQSLPSPSLDLDAEIETIRTAETSQHIELGKQIHSFTYQHLNLRLDRDILGMYRVTVNEGRERRYSFTITCGQGDYDALRDGFAEIAKFLNSDRRLDDLPQDDRVKGHYYGHSSTQ